MNVWFDAIGYQVVWFCAVIGAGRGSPWPGVIAAAVFALLHFATARSLRQALVLSLLGIVLALLLDGSLARLGLAHYAATWDAAHAWIGAPPWILALWVAFALTLTRSFSLLQTRPALAALLGAVGGPLAFLGAARGWHAVELQPPVGISLAALAVGWAIALPLLATVARKLGAAPREAVSLRGATP